MTDQFAKEIIPANLEQEMRQSYLDCATSVILGQVLPDARDGLKHVHWREYSRSVARTIQNLSVVLLPKSYAQVHRYLVPSPWAFGNFHRVAKDMDEN